MRKNNKYTSLFNITADFDLNYFKRIIWFMSNLLNNLFPNYKVDKNLKIKYFNFKKNYKLFSDLDKFSSPARIFCDVFWKSFPWEKIFTYKKDKLNFLEIGCGKGFYPTYLKKILDNRFNFFKGVDISYKKEWENFDTKYFNFYTDKSDNVHAYLDNVDVIYTQSAIEHFENDLLFFVNIRKFIEEKNKNLVQIHLFPSAECLSTYLWHGYRQYSPKNISKITNLFDDKYNKILFKLGASESNDIHKKFITYPKIFRKKELRYSQNDNYVMKILNSVKLNTSMHVSFYALIITSKNGYNLDLFDF